MLHRAGFGPDVVNRVLDCIERRRFLEQPAGKDLAPFVIAAVDNDLHESAGIGLGLPRGGRLAGLQPHDEIADAHSLARFHHKIAI